MLNNTLTKEQIQQLLNIPVINDRKTLIQKWFNDTVGTHKFVWQNLQTGIGKSHGTVDLIKRVRAVTNEKIIVVVPTKELYKSWVSETVGLNVDVFIINTYTMSSNNYDCFLLVIDEVDRAAGESNYFSTVLDITNAKYKVVLAAELEEKHINFLENKGLKVRNFIKYQDYKTLELSPESVIYNVPVEFTNSEKISYYSINKKIEEIDEFFKSLELGASLHIYLPKLLMKNNYDILTKFVDELVKTKNIPKFKLTGMCMGYARDFMKLINERKSLIYNSTNKFKILDKILKEENKQAFLFFSSIDRINEYCKINSNVIPYHSKLGTKQLKENMFEFLTTDKHIASIKSLTYGVDLKAKSKEFGVTHKDVELTITVDPGSSKIQSQQKRGRINRLSDNKDKVATNYNLYIDDFTINGEEVLSQEKKWLINSNKGLKTQIKQFDVE